jgi:paraquat-inducible protein B
MSKKINSTRIGAFVIVSFLLLASGIVILGGGNLFTSKDIAIVYFEGSLQGLNVGAPVAYRGITIGEIKEIRLDVDTATYQITIPVLISLIPGKVVKLEGKDTIGRNADINTY